MIPSFSLSQLTDTKEKEILPNIIMQINKDLQLSGNQYEIDEQCTAQQLVTDLGNIIQKLLQTDFSGLLNLFYRMDIPESLLLKMMNEAPDDLTQNLTLLVLKKEWMKVWLRNKNL
jgi:hypothetical protein